MLYVYALKRIYNFLRGKEMFPMILRSINKGARQKKGIAFFIIDISAFLVMVSRS